jgi:hydrogenase nickel incorporation protein HypA/HybF
MSITQSMMEIVREEMRRCGVAVLKRLTIRVGELTAVEPEALRFCFDACVKDTPWEGAVLDIETVRLMGRCSGCAEEFPMEYFPKACPKCSDKVISRTTGHELDIISMEAE